MAITSIISAFIQAIYKMLEAIAFIVAEAFWIPMRLSIDVVSRIMIELEPLITWVLG